jgi:metallo-beta-lactamase family protein
MTASIRFLGAAGTVTGSKFLVEHGGQSLLIDCGLFQGFKQLRLRNREPLPVLPGDIGAVLLTHAHLDHSGYLPLLVKQGFRGKVWATPATRDLAHVLLPNSGHIQEADADFANRHGFSQHAPALPLYTEEDAQRSLKLFHTVPMGQAFEPHPGWVARFLGAGHILGAASILLEVGGRRILFSGDLGRPDDALMHAPEPPPAADVVVCESTYGDRVHPAEDVLGELGSALTRCAARGGTAVIPVFAVGRAQALLHAIAELKASNALPRSLPIYLDSPMAIHSTGLLARHLSAHRLDSAQVHAMDSVAIMTRTADESKAIALQHGPKVILSASGMATGGRVLHHLAMVLPDHRNMVVLTGYQAPGTRGAALAGGATQLRIHGHDIAVRAERVQLTSASAHAATATSSWPGWAACPPRPSGYSSPMAICKPRTGCGFASNTSCTGPRWYRNTAARGAFDLPCVAVRLPPRSITSATRRSPWPGVCWLGHGLRPGHRNLLSQTSFCHSPPC